MSEEDAIAAKTQDAATEAPTVRRVGRDALLYVPGRFIPALVQILTVPMLTYFFLPGDIGRYDLTFRFILFCHSATTMWICMSTLRFYPACRTEEERTCFFAVFRRVMNCALCAGVALGLLLHQFGPGRFFDSYRSLLLPGILTYIAYAVYENGLTILRAARKPGLYSIATTISAGLRLPVAVLCFTLLNTGIAGMLAALASTYFLAYLLVSRRYMPRAPWRTVPGAPALLRDILLYSAPIWVTHMLNFAILNSDRYLFKAFMGDRGDTAVGLFAVATNLVDQPMTLVIQTFYFAVFPTVAFAWEAHGRASAENLAKGILRVLLLIGLPLVVFLAVPAQFIFSVLARNESQAAYIVAPWIAAASFLYGMAYIANLGLHLAKRTTALLLITIAGVALNILLNTLLLPRYDLIGAGIARVLTNAALVIAMAAAGWTNLHIRMPWSSLLRIALAAAGMGAALHAMTLLCEPSLMTLVLLCAVAAVSYASMLLLVREVSPVEVRDFLRFAIRRNTGTN